MKILQVIHDYLPEHVGGTEVHAHQLARVLSAKGHNVVNLFTERDPQRQPGLLRRSELDGVALIECVHQREYADVRESWRQDEAATTFARVLEAERPEVVHFQHLSVWGARCISHARDEGCATVVTLHDYHLLCDRVTLLDDSDSLCSLQGIASCKSCLARHPFDPGVWDEPDSEVRHASAQAERLTYHREHLRSAQRVIVPSFFLGEMMLAADMVSERQIVQLKAGYPGPLRDPRVSDANKPLRVGFVGGVMRSKGVHVAIEALDHLDGGAVELHVHGPLDWFPDYTAELERAAEGRPVLLHGRYQPRELDAVLANIDVVVLPSLWYENMPLVLHEAWRNGLPVVATNLGGMAETVQHGVNGLLFARGDARGLAEVLNSLAMDREYAARLAAGRPDLATVEGVAGRVETLYQECLNENYRDRV